MPLCVAEAALLAVPEEESVGEGDPVADREPLVVGEPLWVGELKAVDDTAADEESEEAEVEVGELIPEVVGVTELIAGNVGPEEGDGADDLVEDAVALEVAVEEGVDVVLVVDVAVALPVGLAMALAEVREERLAAGDAEAAAEAVGVKLDAEHPADGDRRTVPGGQLEQAVAPLMLKEFAGHGVQGRPIDAL